MVTTINTEEFNEFKLWALSTHVLEVLLRGMKHEKMSLITKEWFNKSLTIWFHDFPILKALTTQKNFALLIFIAWSHLFKTSITWSFFSQVNLFHLMLKQTSIIRLNQEGFAPKTVIIWAFRTFSLAFPFLLTNLTFYKLLSIFVNLKKMLTSFFSINLFWAVLRIIFYAIDGRSFRG